MAKKEWEIRGVFKHHKVKLCRVVFCNRRTDYAVNNDLAQDHTAALQQLYNWRSAIQQLLRETKPLTSF